MTREAIGEIKCPWCGRDAELHRSESRQKLNPDKAEPVAAYPPKYFVVCPPVKGYRGCGTTLANSAEAQARMMDKGTVYGAAGRRKDIPPATKVQRPTPQQAPDAPPPANAAKPAAVPAAKKSSIFDW